MLRRATMLGVRVLLWLSIALAVARVIGLFAHVRLLS